MRPSNGGTDDGHVLLVRRGLGRVQSDIKRANAMPHVLVYPPLDLNGRLTQCQSRIMQLFSPGTECQ